MDQNNHSQQQNIPPTFFQQVRQFLIRYLTPLSIGIGVVGIALFVLIGPLRLLFTPAEEDATSPESDNPGVSEGAVSAGLGADLVDETTILNRQLVPYTTIPDRPRNTVVGYTVQSGDSISQIAAEYGLDRNSIYWSNTDTLGAENLNMVLVGMELNILPVDGVYYKSDGIKSLQGIADQYDVDVWDIINSEYNELEDYTPQDVPAWGMRIVVPNGTGPLAEWPSPIQQTVSSSGVVSVGFMSNMAGACGPVSVPNLGTGLWIPPVNTYVVTERFHGFHSGIDLAYPIGTPIYAADSGTVIFAGWNTWGYGNLVVLDHGNGWTSYYGHLSTWAVSCGQTVTRGQYLGAMGSTGNSTGSHLHFEMRWGHIPQNPSPFINIW